MVSAEDHLNEISRGLTDMSLLILERNKNLIDTARLKLIPLAKMSVSEFRSGLSDIIIKMINTGKEYLMNARLFPENQRSRLVSGAASCLSANRNSVSQVKKNLSSGSEIFLSMRKNEIAGFENMLKILDPDNVLRRGYTITSKKGRIIKSGSELSKDDIIDTRFSDGQVRSKVV